MKLLPTFLLALTITVSLTHAADAPKKGPGTVGAGGPGREMILQKFDANKNGVLDPDEKAAMIKAFQERKGGAPKGGVPKGGAPGAKGGGQMQEMILQKFDANKNGVLDPDEKAAAMKALQERRAQTGGTPGAGSPAKGGTSSEGGSKFRRPPEAPKEGNTANK
jgi:EF hand